MSDVVPRTGSQGLRRSAIIVLTVELAIIAALYWLGVVFG